MEAVLSKETAKPADLEQLFAGQVHEYERILYSVSMALLHNEQDALDAVQEAILQAWRKRHTLREPAYFKTWLTRITIRTCINQTRRQKNTGQVFDLPCSEELTDEILDIRRAIASLDEKTRICTVLFYFEDMTIEEVAHATGLLRGTVKSRLHRARQKIKTALEVQHE